MVGYTFGKYIYIYIYIREFQQNLYNLLVSNITDESLELSE